MSQVSKRQKANDGDEGIFHKLYEPLISRILSFLPTKDAVRTSVLSKKWRHRCTCITKLDLNDNVFYSRKKKKAGVKQCFVTFMYRTVLLTKCRSIESFSLVITNKYDESLFNTWISGVLNRGVKILHIKSHCFEHSFADLTSRFLFESNNLEELVLGMYHCAIVIPRAYMYFGQLKFLKLSGIKFTLDSSCSKSEHLSFTDLKLSLPVLKVFETINCTWSIAYGITLEAPLLERVFILHYPKLLSNQPDKGAVKISASSLKEFTYQANGHISQDFVLLDPSSARNAYSSIILHDCKDRVAEIGKRVILLLKQLSQVQYLKFKDRGIQVLAQSRAAVLPQFGWLRHLELGLVTCEVLLALLQKSPVLMTLAFKELPEFDQELLNSASVPDCFMSTLQKVKFGRLHGYEHELCFAKFVMQNCSVLERLSFFSRGWPSKSKAVEEFKEKLFCFKNGFRSFAIVEFSSGLQAYNVSFLLADHDPLSCVIKIRILFYTSCNELETVLLNFVQNLIIHIY